MGVKTHDKDVMRVSGRINAAENATATLDLYAGGAIAATKAFEPRDVNSASMRAEGRTIGYGLTFTEATDVVYFGGLSMDVKMPEAKRT